MASSIVPTPAVLGKFLLGFEQESKHLIRLPLRTVVDMTSDQASWGGKSFSPGLKRRC